MVWAEHAARMGEMGNAYNILTEKLEGKRPLEEDLGIYRRIIVTSI
jgi:hypothetical protein